MNFSILLARRASADGDAGAVGQALGLGQDRRRARPTTASADHLVGHQAADDDDQDCEEARLLAALGIQPED